MTTIISLNGSGHDEQIMTKTQAMNYIKARLSKGRFLVVDWATGETMPNLGGVFEIREDQKIALIPQVAGG